MNKVEAELRKIYAYEKGIRKFMTNPSEEDLKKYWENRNETAVLILKAKQLDPVVANVVMARAEQV